jgi:hypothetical protein
MPQKNIWSLVFCGVVVITSTKSLALGKVTVLDQIFRVLVSGSIKYPSSELVVPHHGFVSWVMWYYSCNGPLISGWLATD